MGSPCALALLMLVPLIANASDFAVSLGGNGFDGGPRVNVTRDGAILVVGTAEDALFFGATDIVADKRALPYVVRIDPNARAGARGRVLVVGEAGAQPVSAIELSDGRVLVIGNTRDGPARFGDAVLPARNDAAKNDSGRDSANAFAVWLDAAPGGAADPRVNREARASDARGARAPQSRSWGEQGEVTASAAAAIEDGAVVALWFDQRVDATRSKGGYDALVIALGTDGAERWRAHVGGAGQDIIDDVTRLANGDVLVTGSTRETPTFTDGKSAKTSDRCGFPVHCPFVWRLDARTGATKGTVVVMKNGSGYPSITGVVPLDDGGFVVAGDMGRNLAVSSASAKGTTVKLRTESPEGHAYLARYDVDTNVVWAKRADAKSGRITSAALVGSGGAREIVVSAFGDIGALERVQQRGEGPAVLARFSLDDGAPRASIRFGKPDDAPLTPNGENVRDLFVRALPDGRVVLSGSFEERMWLTLASGPRELVRRDAKSGQGNWANTNDAFVAVVKDIETLAKPSLPARVGIDPIEGCVARKERSLVVPCTPVPRETRVKRDIHHTCIEGTWSAGDKRVWSCGPLDDDVALVHEGRELIFLERTSKGRLALYQDIDSGHRHLTARLLDDTGTAIWTRVLDATLRAKASSWVDDVSLDVRDDTLYVVEGCNGYRKEHKDQCDRVVALEGATGKTKWASPNGATDGPIVLVGTAWVVGAAGGSVHLLDRATGKRVHQLAVEGVGEVRSLDGAQQEGVLAVLGNFWDARRTGVELLVQKRKLVRAR